MNATLAMIIIFAFFTVGEIVATKTHAYISMILFCFLTSDIILNLKAYSKSTGGAYFFPEKPEPSGFRCDAGKQDDGHQPRPAAVIFLANLEIIE